MKLAAIYIPAGYLSRIFGIGHAEMTVNFGGKFLYTVRNRQLADIKSNEFYLDDILDDKIELLSCIVGGNGAGKTTILHNIIYSPHCMFVVERPEHEIGVLIDNIEDFHRIYYSPYLNSSMLGAVGKNGKDLSKFALIKQDTHGDGGLLDDFLAAHNSENTKRCIRFNHFYRQLNLSTVVLPTFEKVELSLEQFETNIHSPDKFHNTSYQLRPAFELLFEKIKVECKEQEIDATKNLNPSNKDFHPLIDIVRFEYDLYDTALGKLIIVLERVGNRFLDEGTIPKNYQEEIESRDARSAIEWFLLNAGVHKGRQQYSFKAHLSLLTLIDYVRSLINKDNLTDNWRKIIVDEGQALKVAELYDHFNNSFINDWLSFESKPMFSFRPLINVSSGEQHFLNLFSTLYYHAKNIKAGADIDTHSFSSLEYISDDILLLVDEGDNAFHPQWKKEYVRYLRAIIPLIFEDFKVQIIITSHDPLTLSDIPKNNVVFLERKNGKTAIGNSMTKRTFGANISDMLKDSFFLEDGQIGSFTANIIDKTITRIRERNLSNEEVYKIERLINTIDEPITKFKLAEMLGEATGNRNFEKEMIDNEIAWLMERRDEL